MSGILIKPEILYKVIEDFIIWFCKYLHFIHHNHHSPKYFFVFEEFYIIRDTHISFDLFPGMDSFTSLAITKMLTKLLIVIIPNYDSLYISILQRHFPTWNIKKLIFSNIEVLKAKSILRYCQLFWMLHYLTSSYQ